MNNLPEKIWESSTIHKTRYSEPHNILEVTFKNNSVYHYKAFPIEKWTELLATENVGTYISQKVKGIYDFTLIKAASLERKNLPKQEPMTTTTEVEKIKTNAEKKFEAVKAQGVELAVKCQAIQITDANTLAMAQQVLAQANEFDKAVEKKRKELKEPYLEAGKEIDTIAKSITDGVKKGLELGKQKLRAWNDSEALRKNEEDAANQKLVDYLKKVEDAISLKLAQANTVELCNALIESINKNFPALAIFGIYEEQAAKSKDNFIKLLETRIGIYETATGNTPFAAEQVVQKLEEQQVVQQQIVENAKEVEEAKAIVMENNVAMTSKVRKTWRFEVADELKLPRNFLSQDDTKIRAYMTEIKAELEASEKKEIIRGGVRFYLDLAPQI